MSEQLVEEGWLAPARPGPTRRTIVACGLVALLVLGGWYAATLREPARTGGDELPTTTIEVNEFGRAALTVERRDLAPEVRTARGVDYLVVRTSVDPAATGAHRIEVRLPPGVDPERATLRVAGSLDDVRITPVDPNLLRADVELGGPDEDLDVLLTVPGALLQLPDLAREPVGSLATLTRPFDRRVARDADQRRIVESLRDAAPWLLPLLALVTVGLPLLLWRRARRRFFSMRRPGPGTELDAAPPSSLDPVGAAVLVAGTNEPDAAAAFAGHVLDLVERRQLLMRRTVDATPGAGVLVGLGHADDDTTDPAVHALRSVALDDGITVAVPDSRAKLRRIPEPERDAWHLHVAARARFEGMVARVDLRRHRVATAVLVVLGAAAVVASITGPAGRSTATWLVAAASLLAVVVLTLWMRDARRWRIVARTRRLERAQWLAWRAAIGTADGPALDQRSLPVLAATGTSMAGVRAIAGPDAVGLGAVTTKTIAGLTEMAADHLAD